MLTLISFFITIVGAINWLCIGILQFDFVAGLFGSQSSIFSRIIYAIVGISAILLLVNYLKNKGRVIFDFSKKENVKSRKTAHAMEAEEEFHREKTRPLDLEAGAELSPYANSKFTSENQNYNIEASSFEHEGNHNAEHYENNDR